jgi:hypothetical protein
VASPPNLPAALRHQAAADPEEPWLFRAEGWDWVWHPWGELARWLAAWSERLAALPPGTRVAFPDRSHPDTVILDLAIQGAGLVSVPTSGEKGETGEWAEIEAGDVKTSLPLPPPSRRPGEEAGGALVRIAGSEVEWTAAELVAAGERLRAGIGDRRDREIVVLGGSLAEPVERSMMAWATLAGAAVMLEPDPAFRMATTVWVRPTIFHGTPGQIAELRARLGKAPQGRPPLGRLRTLLVVGSLDEEAEAFWRERGVRVRNVLA